MIFFYIMLGLALGSCFMAGHAEANKARGFVCLFGTMSVFCLSVSLLALMESA